MTIEKDVAAHYTTEDLLGRIREALRTAGADPDAPAPEDLKGIDEFHTGGVQATDDLLDQLAISQHTRVLDIGCGLGGTSRHIALKSNAFVTGVDLTPSFVETGEALNRMVGMQDRVKLLRGSVLDLPLVEDTIDLVTMFHVGMNVADKAKLFSEVNRVLVPGGTFALFDVMRMDADGGLTFPFPWAEEPAFSFVEPAAAYMEAAEVAGLVFKSIRNRKDFALDFFKTVFARIEEAGGPPPVGIHLLMRDTAGEKIQNYVNCVQAGLIAPFELIFRKPV
ncbi:class I SAM-dependent methyltransferase [Ruegeria sp. 2205SS24-7]|uniref:class I SAM-dependent methyltransferase n=1 Tax=Ruegeria discodermiae TaxID=3064389 RepID=UPI002742159B|nr:class I SAM-dependent methyltransferase [Ruegeria sp. 2205SS24-7]MDP5215805.1 class I SAM-dependent methyltransferase [Ruegeria sp. 2205SS24-7]